VQRQYNFLRAVGEVVAQEMNRPWTTPLFFERKVVEVVVEIDEEATRKTTCRDGLRTG